MTDIKTIDDLRRHAIATLEKLAKKEINIQEASVTSKLYENIISSVKTEIDYHKMRDKSSSRPDRMLFLENKKDEDK